MKLLSRLKELIIPSFRIDVSNYVWDKEMSKEEYNKLLSPKDFVDDEFTLEYIPFRKFRLKTKRYFINI